MLFDRIFPNYRKIKMYVCYNKNILNSKNRIISFVVKMENLVDTMKVLEMGRFLQWVDNAGLREKLMLDNYTVFTPSNEAVTDYEDETEDVSNGIKNYILYTSKTLMHMHEGFFFFLLQRKN